MDSVLLNLLRTLPSVSLGHALHAWHAEAILPIARAAAAIKQTPTWACALAQNLHLDALAQNLHLDALAQNLNNDALASDQAILVAEPASWRALLAVLLKPMLALTYPYASAYRCAYDNAAQYAEQNQFEQPEQFAKYYGDLSAQATLEFSVNANATVLAENFALALSNQANQLDLDVLGAIILLAAQAAANSAEHAEVSDIDARTAQQQVSLQQALQKQLTRFAAKQTVDY
jgi:hypothetical protein